jgi:hypothetical protein
VDILEVSASTGTGCKVWSVPSLGKT